LRLERGEMTVFAPRWAMFRRSLSASQVIGITHPDHEKETIEVQLGESQRPGTMYLE
jgi:hypothetical protein